MVFEVQIGKFLDPSRSGLYASTCPQPMAKMIMVQALMKGHATFTLGISDAFLMVPQSEPRAIMVNGRWAVLRRVLPGQRSPAAEWNKFMSQKLVAIGLRQSRISPSLFTNKKAKIALHVDDLLASGDAQWIQEKMIAVLRQDLKLKVEGPFKVGDTFQFLKRHFSVRADCVVVSANPKYKRKLEELLDGTSCKHKRTPLPSNHIKDQEEKASCAESFWYRQAVGLLLYVMQDRPDLQHALKTLASKMSQPGPGDVRALVHCAGFAAGAWDMGSIPSLVLDFSEVGGSNVDLEQHPALFKGKQDLVEVFTDASWADDKRTRGSTLVQ